MLSFELFSEMVTRWKAAREEVDKFEEAMAPFMERPILTIGQDARNALEQFICLMCGLDKNSDLLWWWAFEDVEKVIEVDSETSYNVETIEGLYKYICDGIEAVECDDETKCKNNM